MRGQKLCRLLRYVQMSEACEEWMLIHIQNLPILPALLQTAVLALLSASMSLSMTLSSVFLALNYEGSSRSVIRNPTILQSQGANSVHVLAFTSRGDLLVAESEGSFTMDDWDSIYEAGREICCDNPNTNENMAVDEQSGGMMLFVKSTAQAKVAADLLWKD
jgi:exosome complex component RRP46